MRAIEALAALVLMLFGASIGELVLWKLSQRAQEDEFREHIVRKYRDQGGPQ